MVQPDASVLEPEPPAAVEGGDTGGEAVRYTRSPSDLFRLVLALALLTLGVVFATATRDTLQGLEGDVHDLFDGLPRTVRRFTTGLIQLVALAAPIATYLTLAALRRWRTLLLAALAQVGAMLVVVGVEEAVDRVSPPGIAAAREGPGWITEAHYPGSAYLAGVAAAVTVVAPALPRRWRRWAWGTVAALLAGRVVAGTAGPVDMVATLATGWAVGLVVLLAFGVRDRRPGAGAIVAALDRGGMPVTAFRPAAVDARGSTPWFATFADGTAGFVKVLSSEERSADLLFRLYRAIRLENVGDERPFASLRRTVEHEALLALQAAAVGVRTPRFVGLAAVGDGSLALAYEAVAGRSLDRVDPADVTDDVLAATWEQVAVLRRHRIAHRDLRLANVFLAEDGRPWIIDFGFSEMAVADEVLDTDVAELVASTALVVGTDRAVAAARAVLGPEALAAAAPRLQPLALSGATRSGLAARKGMAADVQRALAAAGGLDDVPVAHIERIRGRDVVMLLATGVAAYVVIHQLSDVRGLADSIGDIRWAWVPGVLVMSVATYLASATSFAGSVPDRLPAWPTVLSQLAGSFANRVTPVKVGGMAVGVRYLEKAGVDPARAVTGVGLVALGGFVTHAVLTGVFLLFAGSGGFGDVDLPSGQAVLVGLAAVLALSGVVLLLPFGRRLALDRLVPALRRGVAGIGQIARTPAKLAMLLGGATAVSLTYMLALWFSLLAFGADERLAVVGVVYLTGSAVAQAAPTPGGVGAVEAALIAGLTAVGVDKEVAVPAVFLFRIGTFWLPVLPGWLALRHLTRHDML
jgi:glycosyltransferase 2 family protein